MNTFTFWQRWLFLAGVVITLFGVFMALFNDTAVFQVFNHQIDPVFWGEQSPPDQAVFFRRWIYGVLGATIAGWGVFVAFVAHYPFRWRHKWAWMCVAFGVGFWYVLDTAISAYYGVAFNAIFNTLLLLIVAPPLIFSKKWFDQGHAQDD